MSCPPLTDFYVGDKVKVIVNWTNQGTSAVTVDIAFFIYHGETGKLVNFGYLKAVTGYVGTNEHQIESEYAFATADVSTTPHHLVVVIGTNFNPQDMTFSDELARLDCPNVVKVNAA